MCQTNTVTHTITNLQEAKQKVAYNRKRSNKVAALKRKNFELTKQLDPVIQANDTDTKKVTYLQKLHKNLSLCACHSLYREHLNNNALEYIGSHTCDHKLCFVCNNLRQKRIRRKYLRFFEDNQYLYSIQNNNSKSVRAVTQTKVTKMMQDGMFDTDYIVLDKVEYDLMHLTLTLPHYKDTGFRGYPYYFDYIAKLFNFLRKKKKWNELVYGGEYGIETTKGKNGLNIHIHSLLMVKRGEQNRNILHKYILQQWNKMSVNPYNEREEFTEYTLRKIMKSNSLLSYSEAMELHPKGSTIITLENIYSISDNGDKVRSSTYGSDAMMKAVMETISYHFEPQCFDKKNKEYDIDLIAELMPELEGKALYRKFGCLHGEKSLNIKTTTVEKIEEDINESGQDVVLNPVTLEVAEREEYTFFVANPANLYHIPERDYEPIFSKQAAKYYLHEENTKAAMMQMTLLYLDDLKSSWRRYTA